jgi:hypothetical protein
MAYGAQMAGAAAARAVAGRARTQRAAALAHLDTVLADPTTGTEARSLAAHLRDLLTAGDPPLPPTTDTTETAPAAPVEPGGTGE